MSCRHINEITSFIASVFINTQAHVTILQLHKPFFNFILNLLAYPDPLELSQ